MSPVNLAWLVLVISGLFESVWAVALGRSEGFTRLTPSLIFGGAMVVSMAGLAWAMRELPTGTAYAVWVGIGASGAVAFSMLTGDEAATPIKIALLLGLLGCVAGLKLVTD